MKCIRCSAPVAVDANLKRLSKCDCELIEELAGDEQSIKKLDEIIARLNKELSVMIEKTRKEV